MATTNGQGSKKKRSDLNLYLIASFFALLRMVIPSAKCHANQCKTFRRATMLWQAPLSNLLLVPLSIVLSVFAVHYSGKILAPWLPRDESSALREEEFIGGMAIITGHAAVAGTPCEGKFTDKFGQIHYLLLEPEKGKEFKKGDKVLIVCRLSATRYLAERTFYV